MISLFKTSTEGYEVEYKLPAKRVIKAGESLTIWSHNSADLKTGDDLAMSGSKNWLTGASVITVVNDKEGNVSLHICCWFLFDGFPFNLSILYFRRFQDENV